MSIGILVPHGKYFAAEHLARALSATIYGIGAKELIVDHLIIIGMRALEAYSKIKPKNFKSVAVIFSDTNFCRYYKWCNDYCNDNEMPVYAMPDLHDYLYVKYTPCYQTITLPKIEINKPNDRIVICHSPGGKGVLNIKGSGQIKSFIKELQKKYPIEYVCLTNRPWEDCIKEKSRAHIFVDQLVKGNPAFDQKRFGGKIPYKGALGKSGIEAMMLGCCTMTTMDEPITEPYFPPPPVILTSFQSFLFDVERIICDRNYKDEFVKQQTEWINRYCSPYFVTRHITRHIDEVLFERCRNTNEAV